MRPRTSKPVVGILGDVDGRIVPVAPPPIPPRRHRPEAGNLDDSDQLIKSQLLYQLSYAGAPAIVFAESSSACCRGHRRPPALLSKLLSNRKTVVKSPGVETGKNPGVSDLVFDANRRSDQTLLATLIEGPARARCGALGVEDPRGQRGELVDLIGAEMREEQPLQSSDVVVLRLLEFLDPFGGDRDFDTTTVVAGRAPDDQSPRLKFGHQP